MESVKIYLGRIYNPLDWHRFEHIPSGAIVVNARGIILDYGEWKDVKKRLSDVNIEEICDFGDKLLAPGFIDLHLHAPQYDYMGRGRDGVLPAWQVALF